MKKLFVLIAICLGFAYFYPIRHERAPDACAALNRRVGLLLGDRPGLAGAVAARHLTDAARAYIDRRFPLLPPEMACVLGYWGSLLKPDLALAAIAAPQLTQPR